MPELALAHVGLGWDKTLPHTHKSANQGMSPAGAGSAILKNGKRWKNRKGIVELY
jgi:hypothetical protein